MGKKEVNVELMLTPCIDLFTMLVCLLLTTAVWNKINSLSTNTSNVTASDSDTPPEKEPEKKVNLAITIMRGHIELAEDGRGIKISHLSSGDVDLERLKVELANLRTRYPERKDLILNTENQVPYNHLIRVFDTLVGNGWPDVGVNTQ